jgi:hypothetical protein
LVGSRPKVAVILSSIGRRLGREPGGDHVQHAEDLDAVANHVSVARLAPAQHPFAIHDERRTVRDVALLVVHAVSADDRPVDVAQ